MKLKIFFSTNVLLQKKLALAIESKLLKKKYMKNMKNAINNYLSKNLEYDINKSVDENYQIFYQHYDKCFSDINRPIYYLKIPINYSFFLFRARNLSEINDFDSREEYSYPKCIHKLGRANLPCNPVFYCSLSPKTAIDEIKKENNESKFVISKWRPNSSNIAIKMVPTYTLETENIFNKIIKNEEGFVNETQKLYLKFIGEQLLSDNYSNSAFLSHNMIYHNNIDAIVYPSVVNEKYPNMALSPQLIDDNTFVLDKVYIVEILPNQKINLDKIGDFSENNPEWIFEKDFSRNNLYLQDSLKIISMLRK